MRRWNNFVIILGDILKRLSGHLRGGQIFPSLELTPPREPENTQRAFGLPARRRGDRIPSTPARIIGGH